MKIAISSTGPDLDADVDPRFGRSRYFIIADPESMQWEVIENSNIMAAGGAGISTAQMVANQGVQVVLTGNCGPNAYQTLSAAGIQLCTGVAGTVRDAIEGYRQGRVHPSDQPSVGAHFGSGGGMVGRGMGGGGRGMGMGMGTGMGRGMGRGMGMGMGPVAPSGPAPRPTGQGGELEALMHQMEVLGQQLEAMQRRIDEMERRER